MSKHEAYISMPRHNGERFAKLMVGQFEQMNATLNNVGKSRWAELFGTPERAARTLARACGECDEDLPCCECPLYPIVGRNVYEPELLEWLEGDA